MKDLATNLGAFTVAAVLAAATSSSPSQAAEPAPARVRVGSGTCIVRAGPDPVANGQELRSAASDPACNRLVKILPGVYDVGNSALFGGPAALEGSGQATTTILGHASGCASDFEATVVLAAQELRMVTVRALAGTGCAKAIQANGASKLTDVTAVAEGGSVSATGLQASANFETHEVPQIKGVTAVASGATLNQGMKLTYGFAFGAGRLVDVAATASGGTSSYGLVVFQSATIDVHHSRFAGATASILLDDSMARVAHSQLEGPPVRTGAFSGLRCFDVYDQAYNPLTCP